MALPRIRSWKTPRRWRTTGISSPNTSPTTPGNIWPAAMATRSSCQGQVPRVSQEGWPEPKERLILWPTLCGCHHAPTLIGGRLDVRKVQSCPGQHAVMKEVRRGTCDDEECCGFLLVEQNPVP